MERVFSPNDRPFDDVSYVAIAVGSPNSDRNQLHAGILHRDKKNVLLLHLAWHHDLKNEPAGDCYLWVIPTIPEKRSKQVAALCRKVWRSNGKYLPFAFSPPNGCIDHDTGKFLLGPTNLGLTCATFVLAVFHAAGLPLVEYSSWPSRDEDREWQLKIVNMLKGTDAPAEHVKAIQQDAGNTRYRPEEVAGAATVSPLPADFHTASQRGQQIRDKISTYQSGTPK